MVKITKKKQQIIKNINFKKEYNIEDAINLMKHYKNKKFNESVDVCINLGIDPKKTDQNIRGITVLPHGIGRNIKIAVFTQGDNIEQAMKNGADIVGGSEIIPKLKNKKNHFDIVIASPDTMHIVSKLGPILGPKGIMPNPKTGTITENIAKTVKKFKKGPVRYKNDKNGIIHVTIGKINFTNLQLKNNFSALMNEIKKLKPKNSKGTFIKKIFLSTTMGFGIMINIENINKIQQKISPK
ncbi:50S ribosomal protein L1 [Buchnera aphidicola]|uniref:50S ribosomal protein L1 n=1 Tax=Buchnera aphidicola TaxID=9 RepID=UPI0034642674